MLMSWAGMLTPVITINDWPLTTAAQGRNVVTAPPGPCRIHVHLPYVMPRKMGSADYDAVVSPGQWVEVEYKPPLWSFSKGSLGPAPQSYRGVVPMVAFIGGMLAIVVLMILSARP
jgi:hypothetical protein